MYSLNQNQIQLIQAESDLFKKREIIQEIGIQYFRESKGNLLATWSTSLGKTVLALKICQKFREKRNDVIDIVVPFQILKTQWEEKIKEYSLTNVNVYVINTFVKTEREGKFLIVDEAHIGVSNIDSIEFNKLNSFNYQFRLYLSATLKNESLKYFKALGLKEFRVDLNTATKLGFFPEYDVYNIHIPFTNVEKFDYSKYIELENTYKNKLINKYRKIPELYELKSSDKGTYFAYIKSRQKRVNILINAENKNKFLKEALPINKKTILLSKTVKTAKEHYKMFGGGFYAGSENKKLQERSLLQFQNNEINLISAVNKLIAGFDDESTDCIIRHSFYSSKLEGIQSLGK